MELTTPPTALGRTFAAALRTRIRGAVLTYGAPGYEEARQIWNGMISRQPAVIARCLDAADVAACVRVAQQHDVPFTVRGGGHNAAGSALNDGGLVIDLSRMRGVRVAAEARCAWVEGGATIGDLDRATQPYGLAAPMGLVTGTGIAGLTLGGGMGWMRRKHGLSCDALQAAEVVTATGEIVRASATEHPDLFWALRGGGGNFGVVTRFEYALYPVGPEVYFLAAAFPLHEARDILAWLNPYMLTAPDAISPLAVTAHIPATDAFPAEHHGAPCLFVLAPWIGDVAEGERALAPFRTLGTPIVDFSGPMPYLDVQQFYDADYPDGGRYYWKSINLERLSPEAVDTLVHFARQAPGHSTLDLWFKGGAMSRVGAEETAFGDRSAPLLVGIEANWEHPEDDAAGMAWARDCFQALLPFSDGRSYFNFPGLEGEADALLPATYGANYSRLRQIKQRYDPSNLFRTHQNIAPALTS